MTKGARPRSGCFWRRVEIACIGLGLALMLWTSRLETCVNSHVTLVLLHRPCQVHFKEAGWRMDGSRGNRGQLGWLPWCQRHMVERVQVIEKCLYTEL